MKRLRMTLLLEDDAKPRSKWLVQEHTYLVGVAEQKFRHTFTYAEIFVPMMSRFAEKFFGLMVEMGELAPSEIMGRESAADFAEVMHNMRKKP